MALVHADTAADLSARLGVVLARMPEFGTDLFGVELPRSANPSPTSRLYADVQLSVYADGETCERYADTILRAYPEAHIARNGKSFSLWCGGSPSWSVYFSDSVCTRVQVGTKKVLVAPPDVEMVEVEEPVYEWRCADPIVEAQHAEATR